MGVNNIVSELDKLYQTDNNKYTIECKMWKEMGYHIYRNSAGNHKVVPPVSSKNNKKITTVEEVENMFDFLGKED